MKKAKRKMPNGDPTNADASGIFHF